MKRLLALLLAVIMICSLVACVDTPDPSSNPGGDSSPSVPKQSDPAESKPAESKPTEPKPTEPKPTEPKPTEPKWPDGRIVIEAEKPSDKYVDLVDRFDMMGLPMYQPGEQPHSARPIAEDGLQYCTRSTTRIVFCAFDSYTYTAQTADGSDQMADEIAHNLESLVGTTEDAAPTAEPKHPASDATTTKFTNLQFGKNYDPNNTNS